MLYENIYVLLAGQDNENPLIAESIRIVAALKANLTAIHINDPNAGMGHLMPDANPKITEKEMMHFFVEAGFRAYVSQIKFRLVEGKPFAKAIAKASDEADLLIMGHHHKNLLEGLLWRGTDEKVADRIQCPILLVPFLSA